MTTSGPIPLDKGHEQALSTLARADGVRLKAFAESLIGQLGDINVVENRTGLVMLPLRDTAQGIAFHLGEVLVSEAHIISNGAIGYGMRRGRDLEAAMAMALVDLAFAMKVAVDACDQFIAAEAAQQRRDDETLLRKVEATRVDMETF